MPPHSASAAAAPRKRGRHLNAAARAAAATTPRAPVARSRVTNGVDILPGIDGRSPTARRYRDICAQVASDQGGAERMSEARMQLVRRFAGLAVLAENVEANLVNGGSVDVVEYSQLTSTLTRVVQRLGINRVAKNVTPTLEQYLGQQQEEP
jgi:hypothetical protein